MSQFPDFARRVRLERALLAAVDPDGERDAVSPLTEVRARQILLELHDEPTRPAPSGRANDDEDLLRRLGADTSRTSGRVPCPAHGGRDRNLSWRRGRTRVILTCFSHQCTFEEIVRAVS